MSPEVILGHSTKRRFKEFETLGDKYGRDLTVLLLQELKLFQVRSQQYADLRQEVYAGARDRETRVNSVFERYEREKQRLRAGEKMTPERAGLPSDAVDWVFLKAGREKVNAFFNMYPNQVFPALANSSE